jgi:site-specific recombinase XerD
MDSPYRETLERYLATRCRGWRPESICHCRMHLRSLLRFLHARYPDLGSLSNLRRAPHIEDWLRALKSAEPPYSDGTRYLFIYHARRFLEEVRQWGSPESPPPGLILPGDFPPRRRRSQAASGLPRPSWRRSSAIPGSPPADTALHRALERYLTLRALTEERRLLRHYRSDVLSLIEFLRGRFPEIDSFAKLTREAIAGWLEWLSRLDPPYSADTRRGIISHVKRFLTDLKELVSEDRPPPGLFRRGDLPPRRNPSWRKWGPPAPRKRPVPTVMTFPLDTPFHQTLKRYLEVRGATLRLGTLRGYQANVLSLIRFLLSRYREVDSFSKLQRRHIEGWLQSLVKRSPPLKNGTRRERIRNLVRFLDDLGDWNWPEAPPPGLIRLDDFPPCDHHLPRPLPPEVDAALVEALRNDGGILSLGLILDRRTGLRIGELSHLELDCLLEDSPGRYSLRVPLGKLRSERVIPIEPETAELIRTIQQLRGERPPGVDPETGRSVEALFPNYWNDFIGTGPFRRKLRSVVKSAGISQNVHPHRLRHSYATELLRNGLSLLGVMKLLGHKTIKMTLRYVEVTNEDLGRDYLRAMDNARQRYSTLRAIESGRILEQDASSGTIAGAFDQLIGRIQARRFEEPDPRRRSELQRLVERLRRAERTLPKPPS